MSHYTYNVKRQSLNEQDRPYLAFAPKKPVTELPGRLLLVDFCPTAFDQLQEGSCTANSWAANFAMWHGELDPANQYSRNFIYWYERYLHKQTATDAGAQSKDGGTVLQKYGACLETLWPYVQAKFATKPTRVACVAAAKNRISEYATLGQQSVTPAAIKQYLFDRKNDPVHKAGVCYGFDVYDNMESAQTAKDGILHMPTAKMQCLGGHENLLIGWDDDMTIDGCKGAFYSHNSWGVSWGLQGNFWIPYDMFNEKIAFDAWVISA